MLIIVGNSVKFYTFVTFIKIKFYWREFLSFEIMIRWGQSSRRKIDYEKIYFF